MLIGIIRCCVALWTCCIPFLIFASVPLSSWNDCHAKRSILSFVAQITDSAQDSFVPLEKRIATFDNDGTLCVEKPFFMQTAFTQSRAAQMVEENPKLGEALAFKVFSEKDPNYRTILGKEELMELVLATHSGMTEEQFQAMADQFLTNACHPRYRQQYKKLVYQPMLELMNYLKANGFKIYLCTGGGTDFVRAFAESVYGIPPEQVIGTSMEMKFTINDGKPCFTRLNKFVSSLNVNENKPINIHQVIGRPPIIAVGNSDGDIDMLRYAKSQKAGLAILVHHDDSVREYAYDEGAKEALKVAKEQSWVVVSMKNDFKEIFKETKPVD